MEVTRRQFLLVSSAAAGSLVWGCGGSSGDSNRKDPYEVGISSNTSDPLFVALRNNRDGGVMYFTGTRDVSGIPESISSFYFHKGNNISTFELDSQSRLVKAFDANVLLEIEHQSETSFTVYATDLSTGDTTISTIDTLELGPIANAAPALATRHSAADFPVPREFKLTSNPKVFLADGTTSLIHVKCSDHFLDGATVKGTYAPANGGGTFPLNVSSNAQGVFSFTLPYSGLAINENEALNKVREVLGAVCKGSLPVALAKDAVCAMFTAPPAIVACETILTSYVMVCKANLLNKALSAFSWVYNTFFGEDYIVSLMVTHPSYGVRSVAKEIKSTPDGNGDTIIVSFPEAASINRVYTTPIDPAPGQSYTFTANVVCYENGQQIELTIVGTDGYTDTIVVAPDSNGNVNLGVPGAEASVVDTLTATILATGKSKVTRIVF